MCVFSLYNDSIAMTSSSHEAFPALSPNPFIVTCACVAPALSAASVLATASPKSLWQCTLNGMLSCDSSL